jgi:hypothetical protein
MVNGFGAAGQGRFDNQLLHINVCPVEGGQLGWQSPDKGGLDAVAIYQARHFDAAALRQVGD